MKNKDLELKIGWLYPDLMSTYGDRGNIQVLIERARLRKIKTKILRINPDTNPKRLENIDLIFGGGAQDRQQEIVMRDLKKEKGEIIKKLINQNIPALFVCGAPQLMGRYYEPEIGNRITGLGIFDMISVHPGLNKKRLIGDIIAKVNNRYIIGFENHGGRTYLGDVAPFAKVIKGSGNNGEDGTEGVVYKNAIGCYFHGPLLPKNPEIADELLKKALEVKYKRFFSLSRLDDTLADKARQTILDRYGIK